MGLASRASPISRFQPEMLDLFVFDMPYPRPAVILRLLTLFGAFMLGFAGLSHAQRADSVASKENRIPYSHYDVKVKLDSGGIVVGRLVDVTRDKIDVNVPRKGMRSIPVEEIVSIHVRSKNAVATGLIAGAILGAGAGYVAVAAQDSPNQLSKHTIYGVVIGGVAGIVIGGLIGSKGIKYLIQGDNEKLAEFAADIGTK